MSRTCRRLVVLIVQCDFDQLRPMSVSVSVVDAEVLVAKQSPRIPVDYGCSVVYAEGYCVIQISMKFA